MQKVKNSKKAKKKKKKDDVSRKLRLKHQSNADIKKGKAGGNAKSVNLVTLGTGRRLGRQWVGGKGIGRAHV